LSFCVEGRTGDGRPTQPVILRDFSRSSGASQSIQNQCGSMQWCAAGEGDRMIPAGELGSTIQAMLFTYPLAVALFCLTGSRFRLRKRPSVRRFSQNLALPDAIRGASLQAALK
jgi:hypothetical protein